MQTLLISSVSSRWDPQMDDFICILCNKPGTSGSKDVVTIREKGSEGINRASQERNDDIVTVPGQKGPQKVPPGVL